METLLTFYTMPRPGFLPLNVVTFNLLLVGCCAYALKRGGAPERIGTMIMALGSILTAAAVSQPAARFRSVEMGILIVDIICVVAFVVLALRAERFWPLWVAAFQIIGTAGHAVKFVDPDIIRRVYAFMLAVWSYPMVALLVIGTWRHQQRLRRFGTDIPWSSKRAG